MTANMEPLGRDEVPELDDLWERYDETLSFVPNSLYTMARRPGIVRALSDLITVVWRTGTLPAPLKPLIGLVSSTAAGCRYCQAHEAVDARMRGVDEARITDVWEFETSALYSDAERSALRFARDASLVPSAVTPEHFDELRRFWDDGQIVEMLAVIGIFGFLNRWNDTMATSLEEIPTELASARLAAHGWQPGKHR
jgi:uncharacterized peroxidase-related enzyme